MEYIIIEWPYITEYMKYKDFNNNAYLINDEDWINQYGIEAYFVNKEWINKINAKNISLYFNFK